MRIQRSKSEEPGRGGASCSSMRCGVGWPRTMVRRWPAWSPEGRAGRKNF